MKSFDLVCYTGYIEYRKDKHYPWYIRLQDKDGNEVYSSIHVTIDQLCFSAHLEMLNEKLCYLNPVETLLKVESMRDSLDMWLDVLGED